MITKDQIITEYYSDNKEKVGFVYALVIPELNAIKFGVTNGTVAERVASLQTGCPLEIIPLASHLCDFSYELEKAIHWTFTGLALKGEWFAYTDVTKLFVWLNFGKIMNAHLLDDGIMAFKPNTARGILLNEMYGNVHKMFESVYYGGNENVRVKPLKNAELEAIQEQITIGI